MKLKFLQQMFIVGCFGCVLQAGSSDEVVYKISANQVQIVAAGKDGSFAYVLMPHDPLKEPLFMAIAPDDSKGYVMHQESISIVNLDSHTPGYLQIAGSVKDLHTKPESVLFSQDGLSAYVLHKDSDNVSVIDVATDTVVLENIDSLDSNFFKNTPAGHDVLADIVVSSTENSITLIGKDSLGNPVHFSLDGLHPCITAGYAGQNSYTCKVKHSSLPSENLQIRVMGTVPTANSQSVQNVMVNSSGNALTLTGIDPLQQGLKYNVPAVSSYGLLTQSVPGSENVTYNPLPGYVGQDSFAFTVTNALGEVSQSAIVTIAVTNTPIANPLSENIVINSANHQIVLTGMDFLGEPFTFAIQADPSYGKLLGFNQYTGVVNYTPNPGYVGTDTFAFTVTNTQSGITSAPAMVTITVLATPVAQAQAVHVGVNSVDNVIVLTAQDPLGQALNFELGVGTGPSHGTIVQTSSGSANFTYTPNSGFIGQDSFVFSVENSNGVSSQPALVTIEITNVPVANSRVARVGVNSTHNAISLTGADPLGEVLTFVLGSGPSHGVISGFNSSTGLISYTPDIGYAGQDFFTFRVKNAPHGIISAQATVSIEVTSIPDASAQVASFVVNSTNNIMILAGQDPLDQVLTFAVINGTGPSHGTISAFDTTTGVLSYTPDAGYVGQDSFMFTVTNSNGISSAPAYAIINLTDTPVANARFKNVGVNSVANPIIVTGQDPLARPCTFALEPGTGPSHGCISDMNQYTGVVTYTPECGYAGQDLFMFTITNSSGISSLPAAVTIAVIDIPVALAQSVSVGANSVTNAIALTGKDPLGEVLVFALEDRPSHGTITAFDAKSGVATYVPNTKFVGQDTFTFTVTNSPAGITSESATVTITVIDIPVANAQSIKVPVNSTNTICDLHGSDPLGQVLTFALEPGTGPSHGTLSGFNPSTGTVVYTPNNLYVGQDSYMFTVTNTSGVSSVPALVTIDVINTPRANARSANVVVNASSAMIALTGQDLLGQPLTFALGANPSHGTIASLNPVTGLVSYVPTAGYVGKDAFTFTVTNSSGIISDVATVNIVVADVPCANGAMATVGVNSANNAISLTGSDPLGKPLTFALVRGAGPSCGTITSFNTKTGALMYTPSHGFAGTDSCMFTVTNATYGITSAPATVTIAVVDIPSVKDQSVTVQANSTGTPIKITGKDPLGKAITFALGTAPLHGTVSAYNPNNQTITYTPNSGYTGSDTFTITATNSNGITSVPATITITIK